MRRILWVYGPISSVHTNLAQVDSFRMREHRVPAHEAAERNATVQALSGSKWKRLKKWWAGCWVCFQSTMEQAMLLSLTSFARARDPGGESDDDYFEDWGEDGKSDTRSNVRSQLPKQREVRM
jgi:hypothetical protein